MTSGDQCFGSRVTLLCTHSDPLVDAVKYVPQPITWAVNGTAIDLTDPSSARFTPTRLNSKASTLSFTVTEEDHRDRVITSTCCLVLNNANCSREESNVVTIDALGECIQTVDTIPLHVHSILSVHAADGVDCSDVVFMDVLCRVITASHHNCSTHQFF